MARNPETKGYVSWNDCQRVWRWFEWGFSVDLKLVMTVASPPGEQHLKQYYELLAYDKTGEPVPLPHRVLGSFPSSAHATVPGMLLGMLYKLEGDLSRVRVWVEPVFTAPKVRALGVSV